MTYILQNGLHGVDRAERENHRSVYSVVTVREPFENEARRLG